MKQFAVGPAAEGMPVVDPWYALLQLGPHLMERARDLRQFAQHKEVRVGAIALGMTEDGSAVTLATGSNRNLKKGRNPTKVCAEQIAWAKLVDKGFNRLIGTVVSGDVQPDAQSGKHTHTLHVCGECRDILAGRDDSGLPLPAGMRLRSTEKALFVSVHPTKDRYEVYTGGELEAFHDSDQPAVNYYRDPGFVKWEVARLRYGDYMAHPGQYPELPHELALRQAVAGLLEPLRG